MNPTAYCESLFEYKRIPTISVPVGELAIGSKMPIRIQSMTTTDTNDTEASVAQCIRIIEAGGEIVRLTTQGREEAENMRKISESLRAQGYLAPLVADVHYSPAAAEIAAKYVEKVRINPGNYTGGAKRFENDVDTMTDDEWMQFLVNKLKPLVLVCKLHETTIRIGVNHGSLSDRIMAKYGDTPQGMVASCMEYIKAFQQLAFDDLVLSIKSSNTRVMVETVRLLVATMRAEKRVYPIHLGVTEAGSDTEGRVKSAAGIGALLIDGIGDTIRVSLTEDPECEIPVAQRLVDYITAKKGHAKIEHYPTTTYSPYEYKKRKTKEILGVGGDRRPVIIADASGRKSPERNGAEFVYTNDNYTDGGLTIADLSSFDPKRPNCCPMLSNKNFFGYKQTAFVRLSLDELTDEVISELQSRDNLIIAVRPRNVNIVAELRAFVFAMESYDIHLPIVPWIRYDAKQADVFQLEAAADTGLLFIDGLVDGLMLSDYNITQTEVTRTSFEILQATQVRFSKCEFISCPGCGRTQYNLQETAQKIKMRFGHLVGLKIGIMGCVINGIGEMADADYGYVGAGHGRISLYRGKELVKKAIPETDAIEALVDIIKSDGKWVEN
ncbi:MAG: (E)-4-hydroxy-3-methylbut-2-enyl-diphosphate synthase [Bacteroidales bacterium]|nr:(E)-4-hydroxy-3-methylbut-2-enyl-diphosphate synthase [Bacteroidales bacterium]